MTDYRPWVQAAAVPDPDLLCTVCAKRERRAPSLMCGGCFGRLRRDISTLVGAHMWLGIAMLNPSPAWKTGAIHQAPGSRIPFAAQLHDHRVDIEGKLNCWARMVLEEHVPVLHRGPADAQPETVARWLVEYLPWISDQRWCDDIAAELGDTARAAYALVPWNRHRRDLPLPCPDCGLLTLSLYGGDELIMCRNVECGRLMTTADYWAEVRKQHAEISGHEIKPSTSTGAAA